ncbi:chalcone isomerase family protein [Shewanella pneumatophori]|uniref:Chalcone isomerase family protein n=1 Tax=Shewanella pneumatophori TaxID=314092 RepID=A0A9X1ZHN8_9GAMM|nr:chalcone isomerase family protein [Shewanella pneumatophori]MCL1139675.1 chalcone isomerase family protein [Shewanella pneumatophori]
MKYLSTLLFAGSVLLSSSLQAKEVSGIQLDDSITVEGQTLVLNGAGVRSKFFIDLYVGSLYVPANLNTAQAALESPSVAVRLNITSGMITADKMKDAINEGFDDATDGNTTQIAAKIEQFMGLFSAEIVEGDQFTLLADKTTGVTAYKNGQAQATIAGEDFRQAVLKIWLGNEPAQDSLKEAMLGQ